jgi:uncharacterized protein (TIGR03435 family)
MDVDRFDIVGTMPPSTTDDQILEMLRNLLIERFKLEYHVDRKQVPGYFMMVENPSSELKPVDCGEYPTVSPMPRRLFAKRETMANLAAILAMRLERPVLDKTGLTGCYDFELDYGDADPGAAAAAVRQIGLKLQTQKAVSLEYLTIDRAQRVPVGN